MQIKDYIQGNKHGKEANRLEREAMNDSFLQDALDGFDAVPGNHAEIIERLEQKIIRPTGVSKNNRKILYICSAAASVLLLIGFGVYFMMDSREQKPAIAMVQAVESKEIINALPEPSPSVAAYTEQMEVATQDVVADIQPNQEQQVFIQPEYTIQVENNELLEDNIVQVIVPEEAQDQELVQEIAPPVAIADEKALSVENESEAAKSSTQYAVRAREGIANSMTGRTLFGEKEFEAYCLKNAAKNICGSDSVSVSTSFYINRAGKPTNIKYERYTCENAKKEMERLLSVSPAWTNVNRQITMTVKFSIEN